MAVSASKMALPSLPSAVAQSSSANAAHTSSAARHSPLSDSTRWHHLTTRTASSIPFVYAVLTTKIYCLPTCPSRLARRANVTFFRNPREAENEGFRACKRCKPNLSPSFVLPSTATSSTGPVDSATGSTSPAPYDPTDPSLKLHHALTLIQRYSQSGEKVSLAQLATEVGLSKWHLQRAFKRRVGRSPREVGEELLEKQRRESESVGTSDSNDKSCDSTSDLPGTMSEDQSHLTYPNDKVQRLPSFGMDGLSQEQFSYDMPFDLSLWNNQEIDWKLGDTTPTGSSAPAFSNSDLLTESSDSYATTPAPPADWGFPVTDAAMLIPPLDGDFDFNSDFYPNGFSPGVEGVLKDLFPEIYHGTHKEPTDIDYQ